MAINPKIKQKAEDIRKKIFGSEVRESLASGIEAISEDVEATIGRQGYVEEQFQDVLDETTGKDVISAPELIAARNGKSNLKTRLDDEHAQVTAQLQQTATIAQDLTKTNTVRYVAHRGVSMLAPENSLPAFELAGKMGFWGCETDILATSDGELVIMHDDTVDRTTDGTGSVVNMTYAQIQALTIDSGANISMYPNLKVPTFEDFLKVCKQYNIVPVIEVKPSLSSEHYQTIVDTVIKHGFETKCIIGSVSRDILTGIRAINKKIVLMYFDMMTGVNVDYVVSLGNAGIGIDYNSVNYEGADVYIENTKARGVFVNAWTVNSYTVAKNMIAYGIDFITSDIVVGDSI